jgi:hypothetical protein
MKSINALLILHPQQDQKTTSQANGKAGNIDKRLNLISKKVPPRNF